MKRIIIIGTVLAALVSAAAAWAADANKYGGGVTVSPKTAGSAKKPAADAWTQTITAKSTESGYNAAPLKDIYTKIYGLRVDTQFLPTCSSTEIEDSLGTGCPSKSLVASGAVQSQLGNSTRQGPTVACDPDLRVFNGGKNYVWYFFIVPNSAACPAPTGSAAPYKGTFSRSGKYLVLNVPLPADVSTDAGNLGLYASLTHEQLVWKKITGKSKGKKVSYYSSVGCKAGKRPWTVKYTDTTGSSTVTGKAKC